MAHLAEVTKESQQKLQLDPSCNAGDVGSILGWGPKIPRVKEHLNLHTASTETACHNWRVCAQQRVSRVLQLRPDTAT